MILLLVSLENLCYIHRIFFYLKVFMQMPEKMISFMTIWEKISGGR